MTKHIFELFETHRLTPERPVDFVELQFNRSPFLIYQIKLDKASLCIVAHEPNQSAKMILNIIEQVELDRGLVNIVSHIIDG